MTRYGDMNPPTHPHPKKNPIYVLRLIHTHIHRIHFRKIPLEVQLSLSFLLHMGIKPSQFLILIKKNNKEGKLAISKVQLKEPKQNSTVRSSNYNFKQKFYQCRRTLLSDFLSKFDKTLYHPSQVLVHNFYFFYFPKHGVLEHRYVF